MEKEKKFTLKKWKDLPFDIQEYFMMRIFGLVALFIVFMAAGISIRSGTLIIAMMAVFFVLCGALFFNYIKFSNDKVQVFEGVYERFDSTYKEKQNPIIGTYGTASITIKINENDFIRASVSGNFKASEDSIIRIYANPDTMIEENDNTKFTSYPMLVKVCKNS